MVFAKIIVDYTHIDGILIAKKRGFMKAAYWAIIFVAAFSVVAMAIVIPTGHELLKQEGNYYTIRNNTTLEIDRYYIESEPATNGWQAEILYDSVIFRQVV